jgi:L-malate glycosyltransferase
MVDPETEETTVTTQEKTRKRVRLVILAPSMALLGGQSHQASRLLARLREESSLEVDFIPHDPRLPGFLGKSYNIKYVRTILTTLLYVAILVIRLPRYQIIHIFSASYYAYLLTALPAILLGKLYAKKVVLNYHSGEAEDHLKNWRWSAVPTIHLADIVVVPSGYLVDIFKQFGLEACPIPNMVDLDRYHYRKRCPIRPIFLTNRLLEPLYNVGCVLKAFARIQHQFPEARLVVAGDGYLRRGLERLAGDLGLRHTTFVGRVSWEKMPELYDQADIYLTATNIDNMPTSIIECFAAGLPVVTTTAGGIPYIVTHEKTGLMVSRDDHDALAACAIRLLENDDLAAEISTQARSECEKYSWDVVRIQWLKLYSDVLAENNRLGQRFVESKG